MTKPSKKTVTLGSIGLGQMGLPMATNLGFSILVKNRGKPTSQSWL